MKLKTKKSRSLLNGCSKFKRKIETLFISLFHISSSLFKILKSILVLPEMKLLQYQFSQHTFYTTLYKVYVMIIFYEKVMNNLLSKWKLLPILWKITWHMINKIVWIIERSMHLQNIPLAYEDANKIILKWSNLPFSGKKVTSASCRMTHATCSAKWNFWNFRLKFTSWMQDGKTLCTLFLRMGKLCEPMIESWLFDNQLYICHKTHEFCFHLFDSTVGLFFRWLVILLFDRDRKAVYHPQRLVSRWECLSQAYHSTGYRICLRKKSLISTIPWMKLRTQA